MLHNIYRVDGEFDVVTPLSDSEESIMAADFNAQHTSWCRNNNAAGSSLNDQLVQLDTHSLMNTPHLSTTVHDTGIDLSLVSNEMAAKTYWSIYPGLVSDHLAVMLTIVNTTPPDSTPRPKRWLLELADWDKYKDELQAGAPNRGGGVATPPPPEFWMGGLNTCQPTLILRRFLLGGVGSP